MQASYTAAGKAVEALKEPLKDRTMKLEAALRGCVDAMKALEDEPRRSTTPAIWWRRRSARPMQCRPKSARWPTASISPG